MDSLCRFKIELMGIIEKIEIELHGYYEKIPWDPSGILIHPESLKDLHKKITENYFSIPEGIKDLPINDETDLKFRGIKIYQSRNMEVNDVKIII